MGGSPISAEKRDGYVVDRRGKIRGEARDYDPYSRFGAIMLYDIDAFGFVSGYLSKNCDVMSEEDILADGAMAGRLYEAKYQVWKRHNIVHLQHEYMKKHGFYDKREFDRLCRDLFGRI